MLDLLTLRISQRIRWRTHAFFVSGLFVCLLVELFLTGSPIPAKAQGNESPKLRSLLARALSEQKSGDLASAERDYKAALQQDPGFAEVHLNLGLVYQSQNRLPDAMAEFKTALRIRPNLAGASFFLGVDDCRAGNPSEAIPLLKRAVREQPEKKEMWIWLARAQSMAGQTEAQTATLRRALTSVPGDADLLYALGSAYEKLGESGANQLGRLTPASYRSEELLGGSYSSSSEWSIAVLHFENALVQAPHAERLHSELGEVYSHSGNWTAAKSEFEKEIAANPRNARALALLGESEIASGDTPVALHDWSAAIAIDWKQVRRVLGIDGADAPESTSMFSEEIIGKLEQQLPELRTLATPEAKLAINFIENVAGIANNPGNADSGDETGDAPKKRTSPCSVATLREDLAVRNVSDTAACVERLKSSSLPPDVRVQLAPALYDAGKYLAVIESLEGLNPPKSQLADVLYWRARAYEQLSTGAFLELTTTHPDSFRVHELMGDLSEAKGEDEKAIEEYRAAVAQAPSEPELHYILGHILWKTLKVPEAREELEAELALNPHHPGALEDLGDTYLLEHQPEKALTYLKPALEVDGQNTDLHRDLGTAYFELKDFYTAESEFKVAISSDHDGSVHYKLARTYQALGEKDKAEQEFAISAQLNRESHAKLERRTERLTDIEKNTSQP